LYQTRHRKTARNHHENQAEYAARRSIVATALVLQGKPIQQSREYGACTQKLKKTAKPD
jgi:hypothetical protein